jgi:hypothetical protein
MRYGVITVNEEWVGVWKETVVTYVKVLCSNYTKEVRQLVSESRIGLLNAKEFQRHAGLCVQNAGCRVPHMFISKTLEGWD